MLDIHPAHHAATTWRDFFIHIATIVLGLLIAIGLEQTVEYVHHRHQRHVLEDDLRAEALYNKEVCEGNIPYFDQHLLWLLQTKAAVDQFRADRTRAAATLPPEPPLAPGAFKDRSFAKTTWTTAKANGLFGLLPREEAAPFSNAYDMEEQADRQDDISYRAETAFRNFLVGDPKAPVAHDFSRLSDQQLEQLSMSIANAFTALHQERDFTVLYYGTVLVTLTGERSYEARMQSVDEASRRFPDPYADLGDYATPEATKSTRAR
jgi:hypothetical protein